MDQMDVEVDKEEDEQDEYQKSSSQERSEFTLLLIEFFFRTCFHRNYIGSDFSEDENFNREPISLELQQKRIEILLGMQIGKNKKEDIRSNLLSTQNNPNPLNKVEVETKMSKPFFKRFIIPPGSKWKAVFDFIILM
jgi:hypothetical protein